MPNIRSGNKRPAGAVSSAVSVTKIATGEIDESLNEDGKSKAAVELGRKGGAARALSLSRKRRRAIAMKAAQARWSK